MIENFQIDGVPTFATVSEPPERGEHLATILFRSGSHDEVLAYAGLTRLAHSLVHASLPFEIRDHVYTSNDGMFTRFDIEGDPSELSNYVNAITAAIARPNWEMLEQVKALLASDPHPNLSYYNAAMLNLRYGTAGPGTVFTTQFGLTSSRPELVATWLKSRFSRQNAALVCYLPDNYPSSLPLPDGERTEILATQPLQFDGTAFFRHDDQDRLAYQSLLPTGMAGQLTGRLAMRLIVTRISQLELLAMTPSYSQQRVDSLRYAFTCVFPTPVANIPPAVSAIIETYSDIAAGHTSAEVVESERDELVEQLAEEEFQPYAEIMRAAMSAIFPAIQSRSDELADLASVQSADIQFIASQCIPELLFRGPLSTPADDALPTGSYMANPPVAGGTRLQSYGPTLLKRNRSSISFNSDGLTYESKQNPLTVRFSDCTAVFESPVKFKFINRAGDMISVAPSGYKNASDLVAAARSQLHPALFVPEDASAEDVKLERRLTERAKDFSGWRRPISYLVLVYLLCAILYDVRSFVLPIAQKPAFLDAVIAVLVLMLLSRKLPLRWRQRVRTARSLLLANAGYTYGVAFLSGSVAVVMVLLTWGLASELNPLAPLPLLIAGIPFVNGWRVARRTQLTGSAKYQAVLRGILWGSAFQIILLAAVSGIAALVMSLV